MNKSESIKELAAAMARAQGAFEGAAKDSVNPHFKSKYADLQSVVSAIKSALACNGLSFTQVSHDQQAGVSIETIILHSSGEWLSTGVVSVPVGKQDAQGYGSAMTYARRYSLSAAFGIAPEDDDGNAAVKSKPQTISEEQMASIIALATEVQADMTGFRKRLRVNKLEDLLVSDYPAAMALLETKRMKEAA